MRLRWPCSSSPTQAILSLGALRLSSSLAARLLDFGLPLTILAGLLAGALLFPQLSLWEAGILAAILAPTDLGLGALVVRSPQVPERIREALIVEGSLNDGIAVPVLVLVLALASAGQSSPSLGASLSCNKSAEG